MEVVKIDVASLYVRAVFLRGFARNSWWVWWVAGLGVWMTRRVIDIEILFRVLIAQSSGTCTYTISCLV